MASYVAVLYVMLVYKSVTCQFPLKLCDLRDSCSCENAEGLIDLHPLARNDGTPRFRDIPDADGKTFYSWNPCYDFDEESCHDVAICQLKDHGQTCKSLGSQSSVQAVSVSAYGLLFHYTHWGDGNYSGHVIITCDRQNEGTLSRRPDGDFGNNNFYLELKSKYACPVLINETTTHPTGSTTTGRRPITPAFIGTAKTPTPTHPPMFDNDVIAGLLICVIIFQVLLISLVAVLFIFVFKRRHSLTFGTLQ